MEGWNIFFKYMWRDGLTSFFYKKKHLKKWKGAKQKNSEQDKNTMQQT